MYAYDPKTVADDSLEKYLHLPIISSIQFDKKNSRYTIEERGCRSVRRGLHASIRQRYYPNFHIVKGSKSSHKRRATKSSSTRLGKTIDRQLTLYVQSGHKKYPKNKMAQALLEYWADHGHTLVAAQVPVYVQQFGCVTQADIITKTPDGQLWMNEVKSGRGFNKRGEMKSLLNVANNAPNQWTLQCYYTTLGMRDYGLDIKGIVIQVYQTQDKQIHVKRRKPAKWIKQLQL